VLSETTKIADICFCGGNVDNSTFFVIHYKETKAKMVNEIKLM